MPNEYNTTLKIDKSKLKQAVKRASLIAKMDSNIISLKTKNNNLIINSANSETGHAHEEIAVEIDGPNQTINIDAGYLLDVLKIIDKEEITLELIGPLNPLSLKKKDEDTSYVYLIMPVRSDS
jgi:DNA polymerase-3 subunit beta